jgi:hypothetical protein
VIKVINCDNNYAYQSRVKKREVKTGKEKTRARRSQKRGPSLRGVFGEARGRFAFEMRGFRLEEEWLSFYIRPADGLQLPAIVQWLKQTLSVRFNLSGGRSGHIWGDRYWSRVLEGEPPEGAAEVDWEAVEVAAETGVLSSGTRSPDRVSPLTAENPAEPCLSPQTPAHPSPPPG